MAVPFWEGIELEKQSARFKEIIFTELVELKPRGFGAPLTKGFNDKFHGSALHHTGVRSIQAQLHEVMLRVAAHFVDIERRGEDDKKWPRPTVSWPGLRRNPGSPATRRCTATRRRTPAAAASTTLSVAGG